MKKKDNARESNFKRRIVSTVLLVLSAAAVIILPVSFRSGFERDPFEDFFSSKTEPTVGIITVWHIVSFKPYVGSLGIWLNQRAKDFVSSYNNLYFEVKSFSPEDAKAELERGITPDIISFAYGTLQADDLLSNENLSALAYPYCASGQVIIFDPNKTDSQSEEEIIGSAGSEQEYKAGKAISCVTDIRGAGDLTRAQLVGKCPYFEIKALGGMDELVQYIGLFRSIAPEKIPYAAAFIDYLTDKKAQETLSSIGLIPVSNEANANYEQQWLNDLYSIIKGSGFPPPL
ncbi:MAG: hypothetical protein K6F68_03050 [Clostridiales bacterium]|nr:hypothetical protein [Clostridiales bacterium]